MASNLQVTMKPSLILKKIDSFVSHGCADAVEHLHVRLDGDRVVTLDLCEHTVATADRSTHSLYRLPICAIFHSEVLVRSGVGLSFEIARFI